MRDQAVLGIKPGPSACKAHIQPCEFSLSSPCSDYMQTVSAYWSVLFRFGATLGFIQGLLLALFSGITPGGLKGPYGVQGMIPILAYVLPK